MAANINPPITTAYLNSLSPSSFAEQIDRHTQNITLNGIKVDLKTLTETRESHEKRAAIVLDLNKRLKEAYVRHSLTIQEMNNKPSGLMNSAFKVFGMGFDFDSMVKRLQDEIKVICELEQCLDDKKIVERASERNLREIEKLFHTPKPTG